MKTRHFLRISLIVAACLSPALLAHADQVFVDDLIVEGSACIGVDCVNGENFGFDTLRLKENNLRIKFDDTSSSGSFPANDWQLTANDSANGGKNKFSIDDVTGGKTPFTVEAGAATDSLFVEGSGDVGFGTSTPVLEMHAVDGDSTGLRIEQDGSAGWTPQTWDLAGNETNFFIRDVTNGSKLPFRIRPGAPTSSLDIAASGNIGLGTDAPEYPLHINNSANAVLKLESGNVGNLQLSFLVHDNSFVGADYSAMLLRSDATSNIMYIGGGSAAYNAASVINFYTSDSPTTARGTERLKITRNGAFAFNGASVGNNVIKVGTTTADGNGASLTKAGIWTNASSRKNKANIHDIDSGAALEAVKRLRPISYTGKQDSSKEEYLGFIAEDLPALVATQDRKGVAAIEIAAVVTKVVQQQQSTIDQQQKTIDGLQERLTLLEQKLASRQ